MFTGGEHLVFGGATDKNKVNPNPNPSYKLPAGRITVLKYRVHPHKVEMGIGSRRFQEVRVQSSGARMRHPTFSAGKVSVGGVRGKCGFDGEAYEFLLFNTSLSDSDSAAVVEYLSKKASC